MSNSRKSTNFLSLFCLLLITFPIIHPTVAHANISKNVETNDFSKDIIKGSFFATRFNYINSQPTRLSDNILFLQLTKTGSDFPPSDEDLAETKEIHITENIRRIAVEELDSDPLKIFLYVYNEMGFIPYGWSLQGSEMTLSTGYGNDYDQSSLLIALYRAAGIPARYVLGQVSIPPDRMANWVGAEDDKMPMWICSSANMFAIPEYLDSDDVLEYMVIHCWVKAYIDGKWLEIDPSYKQYKYYKKMDHSDVLDGLMLEDGTELNPSITSKLNKQIENALYSKLSNLPSETPLKSVLGGQVIIKADDFVPPPDLYRPDPVKFDLSSLKQSDRYMISFMFPQADTNSPLGFSEKNFYACNLSTVEIASKRITLSFTPSSEGDYDIINSYGSQLLTPCREYMLKPVLLVDGEPVLIGDHIEPGRIFPYKLITYYPNYVVGGIRESGIGTIEEKYTIAGSYIAFNIYLAKIPLDYSKNIDSLRENLKLDSIQLDDHIGEILYARAMVFWYELEKYRNLIANEYDVVDTFYHPSIAYSGYNMQKIRLDGEDYLRFAGSIMDVTFAYNFRPRSADHPGRVVAGGGEKEQTDNAYVIYDERVVSANFLYATFANKLESYLFYYLYNSPPTSAMHMVIRADELGIPIHVLNPENYESEMALLDYEYGTEEMLKKSIEREFDSGKNTILIPERRVKNRLLSITVQTQGSEYKPRQYSTFDGAGYLALDDQGHLSSITVVSYEYELYAGFIGVISTGTWVDILDIYTQEELYEIYGLSFELLTSTNITETTEMEEEPANETKKMEEETTTETNKTLEETQEVIEKNETVTTNITSSTSVFSQNKTSVIPKTIEMPPPQNPNRLNGEGNLVIEVNAQGNVLVPEKKEIRQTSVSVEKKEKDDVDELEVAQTGAKVTDTLTTAVSWGAEIGPFLPDTAKTIGKANTLTSVLSTILDSGAEYGNYLQHSEDNAVEKVLKGGGTFVGEVVVKSAGTAAAILGGVGGFIHGLVGEGEKMPLNEATDRMVKYFRAVDSTVTEFTDDVRRSVLDLDPATGTPLDWKRKRYAEEFGRKPEDYYYMPFNIPLKDQQLSIYSAIHQVQQLNKNNGEVDRTYAWLVSSFGLTVGSDFKGMEETIVDMPYVYFEEIRGAYRMFYIWNPTLNEIDQSFKLVISNQDSVSNTYYVNVELSGESESKYYEKIEVTLKSKEEAYIPLRLSSNSENGDMELSVGKIFPAYTIAFKIDSPVQYYSSEVILDGNYLIPIGMDAYKILVFDKDSEHTIEIQPNEFILEDGTSVPIKESTWTFKKADTKIFTYSKGIHLSSLNLEIVISSILLLLIISTVVIVHRRRKSKGVSLKIQKKKKIQSKEKKYSFCIECGKQIPDSSPYCPYCGEKQ
jgi:hypothetical protein